MQAGGGMWVVSPACPYGTGSLSEDARRAVERALADERRSEAVYAAIDAKLGAPSPFRRIVYAERMRSVALEALLATHGHAIPSREPVTLRAVTDRKDACRIGIASERTSLALYDELLAGSPPADVRCIFERLRDASRSRHLPAFEQCAAAP
jgi:hypothetical protein